MSYLLSTNNGALPTDSNTEKTKKTKKSGFFNIPEYKKTGNSILAGPPEALPSSTNSNATQKNRFFNVGGKKKRRKSRRKSRKKLRKSRRKPRKSRRRRKSKKTKRRRRKR